MTMEKKESEPVLRIFLSYAISDRVYAHKLQKILSKHPNVRIFTPEMLSAGEKWLSKLEDELTKSDIFLVLLSPDSADSNWLLHEIGAAWVLRKPIIPIVTHPETKIPLLLSAHTWIKFEELEKPEVINQILEPYKKVKTSHNSKDENSHWEGSGIMESKA